MVAIGGQHGFAVRLLIAELDGEFTLKQFFNSKGVVKLKSGNQAFPDIVPKEPQELKIWGVVRNSVKTFV
ncbi:S24 family peptidase (plasmid) [Diaphorobacter sp. HDW4A]|uniref:LexA family protein n=1 Tax=Diaphorobacter sp. HDW4A TaxID=2714924 RepID=UPI00140C08C7|nr:S24 family peptidase [Diaphorobacter sp. HDW4A]QIL84357.1 S24 family peptidase [Diaphorobacter sp. HDW4A]